MLWYGWLWLARSISIKKWFKKHSNKVLTLKRQLKLRTLVEIWYCLNNVFSLVMSCTRKLDTLGYWGREVFFFELTNMQASSKLFCQPKVAPKEYFQWNDDLFSLKLTILFTVGIITYHVQILMQNFYNKLISMLEELRWGFRRRPFFDSSKTNISWWTYDKTVFNTYGFLFSFPTRKVFVVQHFMTRWPLSSFGFVTEQINESKQNFS